MARKTSPILKNTKAGIINVACTECGKDQCPLMRKPGVYAVPEHKNCAACRARKNGVRVGHSRLPRMTLVSSQASLPAAAEVSVEPSRKVEVAA